MENNVYKRTKILATIGPASDSPEMIEKLINAGINGARLNFSHGSYEEHAAKIKAVREISKKLGREIAILQDLQGPKIRLGDIVDNRFEVDEGDELVLDYAIQQHDGSANLPVQYNLAEKVKVGEPVYIFDGKVRTEVIEVPSNTAIKLRVLNKGTLMSRKGLNLPDTDFGGDVITEKDMADIEFGASRDFDFVAMSFIQSAEDVEKLRQILLSHGSTAQIVAKIETKKAIETDEKLEAIVKATDAIMVARGDMAVEAGNEVVPIVQRKLVNLCRKHGKLCIVATQMLGSMVDSPEPSRAEVSDVANAVVQGADVVMLSDETAQGKYPIEAVKQMKKIILYTQNHIGVNPLDTDPKGENESYNAVANAAVKLAEKINADVIVCETASGAIADSIAAERPTLPIISVTSSARVAGQLALTYANASFVRPYSDNYGIDLLQELKASGYVAPKEGSDQVLAVIVSGQPNTVSGTDTIQIRSI